MMPDTPRNREGSARQDKLRGQAANDKSVSEYMSHLGAGTGVDIGPGAAGEMGGAADEEAPVQTVKADWKPKSDSAEALEEEYPDSGDVPHLSQWRDAP